MASASLSIITVHLDQFDGLAATLASVRPWLARNDIEWVVVDGGSIPRGESQAAMQEEVAAIADAWVAGPDEGIYDAMNKGTRLAGGTYLLYLNAGDELHPGFDPDALLAACDGDDAGMLWGTCHERYPNGELVQVRTRPPGAAWYGMPVNHQNILFRRDLLGDSPYSADWKYFADYDLLGRLVVGGARVLVSRLPIAIFTRGGVSTVNFKAALAEEAELRVRHFGQPAWLSALVRQFKQLNFRLSKVSGIRKLWRKWV